MALPADFSKIYGSAATGGLTPISDVNYVKGWEFVGSNPPTKNDFSYLQNLSDLKSQWLYNNKLQRTDPFGDIKSDGTVSQALANLGLGTIGTAASRNVGNSASQIPDMSYFQSSLGANGWERLPSGRIRQWGRVASYAAGAGVTVTFPIPFPTACTGVFQIMIRDTPSASPSGEVGYSGEPTLTGVQLYHGGSPSWPAFWFAEGY